jgi:antitoxin ParD1/3/4
MTMAMTSLNISLPEPLKAYVETQVAKGDFGTPSEYVRDLIRQDKERRTARLESELLDALNSHQIEVDPASSGQRSLVELLRETLSKLPPR